MNGREMSSRASTEQTNARPERPPEQTDGRKCRQTLPAQKTKMSLDHKNLGSFSLSITVKDIQYGICRTTSKFEKNFQKLAVALHVFYRIQVGIL